MRRRPFQYGYYVVFGISIVRSCFLYQNRESECSSGELSRYDRDALPGSLPSWSAVLHASGAGIAGEGRTIVWWRMQAPCRH
jgi:hypothetical protein